MFVFHLKIAWRNILKNKIYTAINVAGLALGLAGFIFVLLFINHERSYDRWDIKLESVYQVQELNHWALKDGKEEWMNEADSRLVDVLKTTIPQAEAVTRLNSPNVKMSLLLPGREPLLQEHIMYASGNFFKVFPYRFVYGSAETSFNEPGTIVVKQAFAERYFGKANPVGKVVQINQQNWSKPEVFTISGVVAEPSTPSTINFEILTYWLQRPDNDAFYSFAETYLKLSGKGNTEDLNAAMKKSYLPFKSALLKRQGYNIDDYSLNGLQPSIRVVPLQQVHATPLTGKNWFEVIKPVILLSALLLIISIINFVNMFTAQAVSRSKEVGVKKVIGANRKSLIWQFIAETAMQSVAALIIGIILLEALLPYLNTVFNLELSISASLQRTFIAYQVGVLLVLVTLLAGVYPAFFLASYRPHEVLKGDFSHSKSGKNLRMLLVGVQFIIAVGFFVSILIITEQIRYLRDKDPGFNARSVMHLNFQYDKQFADQIRHIDGVQFVGSNNGMIGKNHKLTGIYKYRGGSKEIQTVLINEDGLQALDVKLKKGRLLEKNRLQDQRNSILINESLEKYYGVDMLGKTLMVNDTGVVYVVGILKDIQVAGFDQLIMPTVYTAATNNATGYPNTGVNFVVKFDPLKFSSVKAEMEKLWKNKYPQYPFLYTLVEDDLAKLMVNHNRFQSMVKAFSFLSISLSLIGLFSLAAFLTKQRLKEIAIRKILGAQQTSIYQLLNKRFVLLMLCANIIAWPCIYVATNYWLKEFAYRIEVPVYPFAAGLVVTILATIVTVSIQVRNAVMANPAQILKHQ